ncbi:MAG: Flp pilus assembly protein CpaB [Rhodobacteraceae bacterium]|jgi:pilus assembly protein CpaB|uniref:Flp pilus assembly protein CpaB n=1 Tax=Albidovulum sp. TaxID=1872424 RepID=UPI001D94DC81|nr:Flp pilus assembly protein CpaB [uncultured Defluviimonas sp.]MCB2126909.1 Flp pilus assembly protein CpaB [Paracoccaceae bacterium]MCC0069169.1 Flp pilus assembly protein CpaB [Paracoccaceae bacterium]
MRLVFALVLVLGVALAGFAVYMAQGFIAQTQAERDRLAAEQANAPKLVNVVVAKRAMKYGDRFTRDDLEVIKVQEGKTPTGIFNAVVAPQGGDPAIVPVFWEGETRPRAALRSYEPFEPVLLAKITEPGIDAGINANLSAGMRAFAINVDVTSGVSGFLRPGDRVDVYWSGAVNGQDVAKLIDSAVRLIAINQSADADRSEETMIARTVTVEATPEQVAALALAQQTGRLTLSLVGTGDEQKVGAIEINRNTLLGIVEEAPVQEVAAPKVCTIRTNKGGEIVETVIPCTN